MRSETLYASCADGTISGRRTATGRDVAERDRRLHCLEVGPADIAEIPAPALQDRIAEMPAVELLPGDRERVLDVEQRLDRERVAGAVDDLLLLLIDALETGCLAGRLAPLAVRQLRPDPFELGELVDPLADLADLGVQAPDLGGLRRRVALEPLDLRHVEVGPGLLEHLVKHPVALVAHPAELDERLPLERDGLDRRDRPETGDDETAEQRVRVEQPESMKRRQKTDDGDGESRPSGNSARCPCGHPIRPVRRHGARVPKDRVVHVVISRE
jgi:hypothetical protein